MKSVKPFPEKRFKLKVNESKSAVDRPWRRKFLGFSMFHRKGGIGIRMAPETIKRLKDKLRQLTSRSNSQSIRERIKQINTYLISWLGYFALGETPSVFKELEGWLR